MKILGGLRKIVLVWERFENHGKKWVNYGEKINSS
jgi:hypothetical protein